MEQVPHLEKFDSQEVKDLRDGLINADADLATDMVAGFLAYNGYGVNRPVIHELVANGMSKVPFERFKQELEKIALEN
jgi:hypothetical protein